MAASTANAVMGRAMRSAHRTPTEADDYVDDPPGIRRRDLGEGSRVVGWVGLVIVVLLAVVIAGWLWWRSSRDRVTSTPAGGRAIDEEIVSTIEPDAVPVVPPPRESGSADHERAEH
jgi:hypothetical protein